MRITITTHPKSKQEKIIEKSKNEFEVWVTKPAIKNKANQAIINIISKHLNIQKGKLKIIKGSKSRKKIMDIL